VARWCTRIVGKITLSRLLAENLQVHLAFQRSDIAVYAEKTDSSAAKKPGCKRESGAEALAPGTGEREAVSRTHWAAVVRDADEKVGGAYTPFPSGK